MEPDEAVGAGRLGAGAEAPLMDEAEAGGSAADTVAADRPQERGSEEDHIEHIAAEIDRLLESFDDRLAVVSRHLDRVLDRRP